MFAHAEKQMKKTYYLHLEEGEFPKAGTSCKTNHQMSETTIFYLGDMLITAQSSGQHVLN